jgi:hypothetical protein
MMMIFIIYSSSDIIAVVISRRMWGPVACMGEM